MVRKNLSAIIVVGLFVLSFVAFSSLGAVPNVYAATTITLDSSSCTGFGGAWNSGTSTCTLTGSVSIAINSGDTLVIPVGTTLALDNSVDCVIVSPCGGLTNEGAIINDGSITVDSALSCQYSGSTCLGIWNKGGTITNDGTITIGATYSGCSQGLGLQGDTVCWGIWNMQGTITNGGTITIGAVGSCNVMSCVGIENYATIINVCSGTISPTTEPYFDGNAIETSQTVCTTTTQASGVPEFPIASLSFVLLVALLLPALLVMSRKFRARPLV